MANTIRNLEKLGYTVGIAHGSVEAEQKALAQARNDASVASLTEQAAQVVADTTRQLSDAGQLPDDPAERREVFAQLGEQAFRMLQERQHERVAFHERALEIAKEMPDVWVINGPGITNVYVACKPDGTGAGEEEQAFLDALADPEAHAERVAQAEQAEASQQ